MHEFFCEGGANQTLCPRGFYCPEGTGLDLMRCPPGTYNDQTRAKSVDDCSQCEAG